MTVRKNITEEHLLDQTEAPSSVHSGSVDWYEMKLVEFCPKGRESSKDYKTTSREVFTHFVDKKGTR